MTKEQQFEATLVNHCAATLAGHKTGSLFSYRHRPGEAMQTQIEALLTTLRAKGVEIRLLKQTGNACLIYVYRPSMLAVTLMQPEVSHFLQSLGYREDSADGYLEQLTRRIGCVKDFPHEIGVFLGYPLGDVQGFIAHRGTRFRCLGCWKAYGDEEDACKRFHLYRKCRRIYTACYQQGMPLSRLTVTA